MDFSTIKIMSKKVRGNDVDFSISEITSKKYVEMTWKFVEIWSFMYRRNINVYLTWSACWERLNSGSAQAQILLVACGRFAMVRISDNGPGLK